MNPNSDTEVKVNPNADLLEKLRINKQSAFLFRRRRQGDWTDNYTLYRDKVQLNRLTQRQSVNIPLIKSTMKTLLKDIDDPPMLYFSNLDNQDQPELFYNEYWKISARVNQLIIKDVMDKRQALLFGRTFKGLNICNGRFEWEVVDPQDMLIDRYVDPSNIDSARFLIHEHIYVPLSSLMTDAKLNKQAVARLQEFMGSELGIIRAEENQLDWVEKQRRMASLGVIDTFNPVLGETYIELNKWFIKEFNKDTSQDEIKFLITAEDMEVLYSAPLDEYIGKTQDDFWKTHYPYTTWGDETERTDFWSDGVIDGLRTLNKVINAYISQKVENRTLKSFGMNWYNSSLGEEGFAPQTFEPLPWGMYPIPVPENMKIGDVFMNVPVPDLDDVIKDIEFLMGIAERVSSATATQEGVQEQTQVTLGEVQLQLANAKERVKSMAVYYTASWEDFGLKYVKMLEAAHDIIDPVTIHAKGRLTKKNYSKTISPEMWATKQGYQVEVRMKQDMQEKTGDALQKLQYSKSLMPMNPTLDSIIKKKSLEFADLSASEMSEVLKTDEEQMQQMASQGQPALGQPPMGQPGQPQQGMPMQPQMPQPQLAPPQGQPMMHG